MMLTIFLFTFVIATDNAPISDESISTEIDSMDLLDDLMNEFDDSVSQEIDEDASDSPSEEIDGNARQLMSNMELALRFKHLARERGYFTPKTNTSQPIPNLLKDFDVGALTGYKKDSSLQILVQGFLALSNGDKKAVLKSLRENGDAVSFNGQVIRGILYNLGFYNRKTKRSDPAPLLLKDLKAGDLSFDKGSTLKDVTDAYANLSNTKKREVLQKLRQDLNAANSKILLI
jgi:hypothetical protein